MREIIFVYAGGANNNQNRAPYTITRNVYDMLVSHFDTVHYFDWCNTGPFPEVNPDTIILGHPNYPQNTSIQHFFSQPYRTKLLIHPLHTSKVQDNFPFDALACQADHIFSICGPYWIDTIESTPFAHWKPKITRLDMAVDSIKWPYRKEIFNNIGNRKILYVGSSIPNKNLGLLTEIIKAMPDVKFEWYGGSDDHPIFKLPNTYVEGWQNFTDDKVSEICDKNDIFLNTSYSDANASTISEFGLASGLIPICTETSGYWKDDCFVNIPLNDVSKSVNIIRKWLNKSTEELQTRSKLNRQICEEKYTWKRFCDIIWNKLQEFL